MVTSKLVKMIAAEVLMQLQAEKAQPRILILSARESAVSAAVLSHLDPDSKILFLEDMHDAIEPERMILPLLTCSHMADLAAGRSSDPSSLRVLERLLRGQPVEVFEFEYQQYRQTAPTALFGLFESYRETLASFGVQEFGPEAKTVVRSNRKLVTEKDILETDKQGASVLRVALATKVTPLARDCARERAIKIENGERVNR